LISLSATEPGFHYVDQDVFPLSKATPINAKKGDVVIFSYLLIHGSYLNVEVKFIYVKECWGASPNAA
jgi:ectoine hydroxylase-related dioxygenase (phytanoyl-CoA dioxygenase family)